jgi:hypothetical protein
MKPTKRLKLTASDVHEGIVRTTAMTGDVLCRTAKIFH